MKIDPTLLSIFVLQGKGKKYGFLMIVFSILQINLAE